MVKQFCCMANKHPRIALTEFTGKIFGLEILISLCFAHRFKSLAE